MGFYRKATKQDFDEYERWYSDRLSPEARRLADNQELRVYSQIRKDKGWSLQEAKVLADNYRKFYCAYRDFKEGNDVYIDY